jgi:zinc transport system substrate-binding protein
MRTILIPFFLALFAGFPVAGDTSVPVVAVSILPQAEFVERIAGDQVRVLVLVGPGASPHSYEPTPRQMSDLSKTIAWFSVGVEFERALLPKIKSLYPKMKIVDTSSRVTLRKLNAAEAIAETVSSSDPGHKDEQGGPDPHIWLGHEAVKAQLEAILEGLKALLPARSAEFTANHAAYLKEIDAVFTALGTRLAPLKGKTIFVYHPSFGYFLDNFGIRQEAVEVGGKEPTQKTLALLIQQAKAAGAKLIFVQKQFSLTAAKTVAAAIGGKVVEIDPLARNWLANIQTMGAALASSMEK